MFLQKTVKGLISQMEDRRVRLWPRHLWGLWLWGQRPETGNGKRGTWVRSILKYRHITTAVPSLGEQKSNPAVVHTPPSVTHATNCLTLVDGAQCCLWVYKKMDKHRVHSIKKDSRALSDNISGFPAAIVAVLWRLTLPFFFFFFTRYLQTNLQCLTLADSSGPLFKNTTAKILVKGHLKNGKIADIRSRHPASTYGMRDIFICKWVVKEWVEFGFNSNVILERLRKRQDMPVSSESCDMSALCLQPAASQTILTFLLGSQRKWKKGGGGRTNTWRETGRVVRERQKNEQSRCRLMTLARWVRVKTEDVVRTTERKWNVWNGKII